MYFDSTTRCDEVHGCAYHGILFSVPYLSDCHDAFNLQGVCSRPSCQGQQFPFLLTDADANGMLRQGHPYHPLLNYCARVIRASVSAILDYDQRDPGLTVRIIRKRSQRCWHFEHDSPIESRISTITGIPYQFFIMCAILGSHKGIYPFSQALVRRWGLNETMLIQFDAGYATCGTGRRRSSAAARYGPVAAVR